MPQKRNPDALELARGQTGPLLGRVVAMLSVLKGTPSGYNKDFQEDKALLFDSFDTLDALLPAITGTITPSAPSWLRSGSGWRWGGRKGRPQGG